MNLDLQPEDKKSQAGGMPRRKAALATLMGSGANTMIIALQAIALVPLYLKACGANLYGAWLASGDFLVWMQSFDLGLPNLLIQKAGSALGQENHDLAGKWFISGAWFMAFISVLVTLIGCSVSTLVPLLFAIKDREAAVLSACFAIGSAASGISLFNSVFIGYSRAIQETRFLNWSIVLASLVGLGVSFVALLCGWGLWSVALGLVTRALLCLIASFIFMFMEVPVSLRGGWWPDKLIIRSYFNALPATAAGGIAHALMYQSETALVGVFVGPSLAAVYNLTRKAIEFSRSLVDNIAFATYGGFAHLFSSASTTQVRKIYHEIRAARFVPAIATACGYLVVNSSLVNKWVGRDMFGGEGLSLLIAMQFIFAGEAFLISYLYRAAGQVVKGSWLLGIEALLRISLMLIGLHLAGILGPPIAAILICVPFVFILNRCMNAIIGASVINEDSRAFGSFHLLGMSFLGISFLLSLIIPPLGWWGILISGFLTVVLVGVTMAVSSTDLRPGLFRWISRRIAGSGDTV